MKLREVVLLGIMVSLSATAAAAQGSRKPITNADVVNLTKSGVSEQTIILMIRSGTPQFDVSADAVIDLKKQGVSDAVLNAMLTASAAAATATGTQQQDCSASLNAALAYYGPPDKLASVQSVHWHGSETITGNSRTASYEVDRVVVLPSNLYISLQQPNGGGQKLVFTPAFNYLVSGKMTTAIPDSTLQELLSGTRLDPLYVAQHRDRYNCTAGGSQQVGNVNATRLHINGDGAEGEWVIDPATGRLLKIVVKTGVDESVTDFSDWRQMNGMNVPFSLHNVKGGVTTEVSIADYAVNGDSDASYFQRPAGEPEAALTLKVLQSESVPYVVQTNGGISTNCSITGSTYTSMNSSTYGNTTSGTATTTPNLQMNCNSSQNTFRWAHVLNAMFVEASDGNAYIIACDRAWRWSKCTPLRAGDTFLARRSDKGFVVQSVNSKSKEQEATYSILQSKSLRD
ncbi:MAG TPA: hypothetical protein VEJ38_14145 [Candidatus Acidoferrales bacterium]|nr:hypothetical protein [Candidatus Acidoferrales bacterium]